MEAWPWAGSVSTEDGGHSSGGSLNQTTCGVLSGRRTAMRGDASEILCVHRALHKQRAPTQRSEIAPITQFINHPGYNEATPKITTCPPLKAVSPPFTFTDYIKPVCLAALRPVTLPVAQTPVSQAGGGHHSGA
ncbi:unnamed protein product [Knipowitschia caucasica]|uniref:Peptidase S1 domain-containing protein n=1 Tax=Knipowitschia caucasica TaxID=637954 RepID=A0AAV2K2Q2_KNICA